MYSSKKKVSGTIEIKKQGKCFLCKRDSNNLVRHHDHFTGEFLGYACDSCNKIKKPDKIRIFVHNLKGYDSHFIIKYGLKRFERELDMLKAIKVMTESDEDGHMKSKKLSLSNFIKVLGKSKEKLFFIQVGRYILQDSFCHLPFSLSQLIKDFVQEKVYKTFLPSWYTHKEAYPYEWFNTYEKFNLPFQPDRETFYFQTHLQNHFREGIRGSQEYLL
jgi:hypothetical protein